MDEDRARHVRPRRPALTRTTIRLLPALVSDVEAGHPRLRSHRHVDLVEQFAGRSDWAGIALHACLEHLLTSSVTEAARVWVVDAWPDPAADAFCLVYRPPLDGGRVVGLRRARQDALDPGDWRIGDMTTWGYDLRPQGGPPRSDGSDIDPVAFGWNVADFDAGEPLGYVTTILRHDAADIGWWGNLGDDLPRPPDVG